MINNPGGPLAWWGRHKVLAQRLSYWQIGPLHLWAQKLPHQWRLSWQHATDWLEPTVRILPYIEDESAPSGINDSRFAYRESAAELAFLPALADRTIVSKLESPLDILAGEEATLFISSPLWIRLEMTEPHKLLLEIPSFRLSDTWFGPVSNLAGEMAYAARMPAVLRLQDIPFRPHCAITAVQIRNNTESALHLERLSLPLPRLTLFHSPRSGFWTDTIVLERAGESEMAQVRLERQPPPEAAPTQFIASPRVADSESNKVIRAFSALFRERSVQQ